MSVPTSIRVARFPGDWSFAAMLKGEVPRVEDVRFDVRRVEGGKLDVAGPDDATPEEYKAARDYLASCLRRAG